jgi:hypothetical protein
LYLNIERGNVNQEGRGSHGSQYVAVAACREPQQLFKNGATVAGVVCHGGLISDLFSASQIGFSSRNSSGSSHYVWGEYHDIPGS